MYALSCVSVVTMGYHVIDFMYVLVMNLRVPPMNLCIGVGTRFHLDSLVETLGHFLKFFVLVEQMNLRLCDAYQILEVTLEYLGDIRVLVDLCLKVLFQYELYDRLNGNNSFMLFYYGLLNRSIRNDNFEVVSYPTITSSFVLRCQ